MSNDILKFSDDENGNRPTREQAEDAVRILLRWAGDNPERAGLLETPSRVVRAYEDYFAGYTKKPEDVLQKTFEDIENYDDIVLVKDIDFVSHCEHHMAAIIGKAHVAYWPQEGRVVGISKLARVVDILGNRLTSQESMTAMIADTIDETLMPKGVAVLVQADHQCMSIRGAVKPCSSTVTSKFTGIFKDDAEVRERFMRMVEMGK